MNELEFFVKLVRLSVEEAVERNIAEGILLSGGLDTSILATIASRIRMLRAFTVALEEATSPDIKYAELIAEKLKIEHEVHVFSFEEAMEVAPKVIKALGVFDPMEIRNSIPIYIGLREAAEHVGSIMTGDGADELFAGYSFLFNLNEGELEDRLRSMWRGMSFSAKPLGDSLNIKVTQPYLDPKVLDCAAKTPTKFKVRVEGDATWGKWILRKAFEDVLPPEITWRVKTPIEAGCGTSVLPKIMDSVVSDEEFKSKKQYYLESDGVKLRDKEQLTYYEIYRKIFGPPYASVKGDGKTCPDCRAKVPVDATYCRVCGKYPLTTSNTQTST